MKNIYPNSSRRSALKKIAGTAAAAIAGSALSHRLSAAESQLGRKIKRQSKSFRLPLVL